MTGNFYTQIIFRDNLLLTLYNTTSGSDYIKILSPFFCFFYLESILYSILQGSGHAKKAMQITTIGVIIKVIYKSEKEKNSLEYFIEVENKMR